DVGDVNVRAVPLQRQRVVEVLGRLRVDRERKLTAEIHPPFERRRGGVMRLEPLSRAGIEEQGLEYVLDPLGRAQHPLHACAPAPAGHDGEIAGPRVPRALAVDHDWHAGGEIWLADEQLSAPGELYNNRF